MLKKATVYIRQGVFYIPTEAELIGDGSGIILTVDPVYTGSPTEDSILKTLESIIIIGHPQIPTPKMIGGKASDNPVLRSARVRSYRKFVQNAVMYTINWDVKEVILSASLPNNRGGWFDIESGTEWMFPPSVPLQLLVKTILGHAGTYPELLILPLQI